MTTRYHDILVCKFYVQNWCELRVVEGLDSGLGMYIQTHMAVMGGTLSSNQALCNVGGFIDLWRRLCIFIEFLTFLVTTNKCHVSICISKVIGVILMQNMFR